jgi:hypothetical protein
VVEDGGSVGTLAAVIHMYAAAAFVMETVEAYRIGSRTRHAVGV